MATIYLTCGNKSKHCNDVQQWQQHHHSVVTLVLQHFVAMQQ